MAAGLMELQHAGVLRDFDPVAMAHLINGAMGDSGMWVIARTTHKRRQNVSRQPSDASWKGFAAPNQRFHTDHPRRLGRRCFSDFSFMI